MRFFLWASKGRSHWHGKVRAEQLQWFGAGSDCSVLPLGQQLSACREEWQWDKHRQCSSQRSAHLAHGLLSNRTKWSSSLNEKEKFENKHKSQNCSCCLEFAWISPSGKTMIQLNGLFTTLPFRGIPKSFQGQFRKMSQQLGWNRTVIW